jgi:hypothetical protein
VIICGDTGERSKQTPTRCEGPAAMTSHRRRFNDLLTRAAKSKRVEGAESSVARKPRRADVDALDANDQHDHVGAKKAASKTGKGVD